MAQKTVIISDLGGDELTDETHARLVITDHPQLHGHPVQLDVSTEESGKLQTSSIALVTLQIFEPNVAPRRVVMDAATFAKVYKGIDMDAIVASATPADEVAGEAPVRRRGRPKGAASTKTAPRAAKGDKIDYSSLEHAGRPHRGRITEAEKETVRDNLKAINERLVQEGVRTIDPESDEMQKKYFS